MIGVTIGVGDYAEMARGAAREFTAHTGVPARILGDAEFARAGLRKPYYLKLRLFDLVEDDDIIFFDADIVCLNDWDPTAFRGSRAVAAVRDRVTDSIRDDAARCGIGPEDYFNAGLFIISRPHHLDWLGRADRYVQRFKGTPLYYDQTALNATRVAAGVPIHFLDRRYNWVGFGDDALSLRMEVFMAHTLVPADKQANVAYFKGAYQIPQAIDLSLNESKMREISGSEIRYRRPGRDPAAFRLRGDGTLVPPGSPDAEGYWFVHDRDGRSLLALASQGNILAEFAEGADGSWDDLRHPLRPSDPEWSA